MFPKKKVKWSLSKVDFHTLHWEENILKSLIIDLSY